MSTSNLSLEYADAPLDSSASISNATWVPFIYNDNIPIIDSLISGYVVVNIDIISTISDARDAVYAITTATADGILQITGFNKLYFILNSTNFTHIVNGTIVSPQKFAIVYGAEAITLTYNKRLINTAFIGAYVQDESIFLSKESALYNITKSEAICNTQPTGTIQYTIYNGATIIGSITFSPGSNVGVISISNTLVGNNIILRLQAPNVADATLATIGININMEG